jgi:hypothetical protein
VLTIDVGGAPGGTAFVKLDGVVTSSITSLVGCPCGLRFHLIQDGGTAFRDVYLTHTSLGVDAGPGYETGAVTAVVAVPTATTQTFRLQARRDGNPPIAGTVNAYGDLTAITAPFGHTVCPSRRAGFGLPAPGQRRNVTGTPVAARSRAGAGEQRGSRRAFRGLALVFTLSFVNLVGVLVMAAAIGGVEPWTRWQFIGLYGVLELASGLANVISPNIWRLPVAELQTGERTKVKLAASTLLLPHWGGLARAGAGLVLVVLAGWQEGVGPESLGLVPFVLALTATILAVSAVLGRAGVARPDLDVVQFSVRWGGRTRELTPLSIGASVLQFLLSIVTLPAARLLPPSMLYRPELAPSPGAVLAAIATAVATSALAWALWSGRIDWRAPREQQCEAEQNS